MKPSLSLVLFSLFLCFFGLSATVSSAAPDTVYVQTFTFGSKQDSTFIFPKPGTYQKVLMYYTLKCNPAQSPACGQWDYLTYTYLYQKTGIMDSTSSIDSVLDPIKKIYVKDTIWTKHERLNQYELGRYITPYGINLSLGNGFTWTYDVTDYVSLLHDSVHLAAGNWQELLNLKFAFIKGTPARMPYKVVNVWNGEFNYGQPTPMGTIMGPKTELIDPNAAYTKMVIRVTGHGEDGSNCAEFCGVNHFLYIDGTQRWAQFVWRSTCAYNPVADQGGTWIYQRANWCPGSDVKTYSSELTPYVKAGNSSTFKYDADAYTTTSSNSGNSNPYYDIETQLVYYGTANFKLDAALENILAPTTDNMFAHNNPVCSNPVVVIKNNGTTPLTSATITYGIPGGPQSTYQWEGNLNFLETDTVTMTAFYWGGGGGPFVFHAKITNMNGQDNDEYANDDEMFSNIPITQKLPQKFVILTKTNNAASDNAYTLTDIEGNILYHRENMNNNTLYKDTVNLPYGCYTFRFTDASQDGLYFFANTAQGTGSLRFVQIGNTNIKTFNPDFGAEALMNFNVGYGLAVEPDKYPENVDVFPNPSNGIFNIDATSLVQSAFRVEVYNLVGKQVYTQNVSGGADHVLRLDMNSHPQGVYIVNVIAEDKTFARKVLLTK